MKKIMLVTLLTGNGGIASWSRRFIKTFPQEYFIIYPIDRAVKGRTFDENSLCKRLVAGIKELKILMREIECCLAKNNIDILHATTSGSIGTFRDYLLAKKCKKANIKTILHCRYGCIPEDVKKNIYGKFLVRTFSMYDQIWVLDKHTHNVLKTIPSLKDKVYITPNSINVPATYDNVPKNFTRLAFIGNLIPSKGIFELIEAVKKVPYNIILYIVGKGDNNVLQKIKDCAGDSLGKRIILIGQLPNQEAVDFMRTVDIIALPTYYPWEAFPISILEAMSLGKLVISTNRAAIPDMLTALDGSLCGILVAEKSVDELINAINYCIEHPEEANDLCAKAYKKVYESYRMEVIYNLYISHYRELVREV